MPKSRHFSDIELGKIRAYKDCGKSNRWIAQKIRRSKRAIDNFVNDMDGYDTKSCSG